MCYIDLLLYYAYEHITEGKIISNSAHLRDADFVRFFWQYMKETLGEFTFGWSDITTMDLKGIEPYVSSGFM